MNVLGPGFEEAENQFLRENPEIAEATGQVPTGEPEPPPFEPTEGTASEEELAQELGELNAQASEFAEEKVGEASAKIDVSVGLSYQGIIAFLGDGQVVDLSDVANHQLNLRRVQRAVLVARLRAWADLLEQPDLF